MSKKKTVDIVVCAFNEEANIGKLLKSIFAQKEENFKLAKVVVISDGSTDSTVSVVKSLKNTKIKLIQYSKRLGLAVRLNKAFKISESDVLIRFDADVIPADNKVMARLVQKFGNNVGLVGGFRTAVTYSSFVEEVHKMGDFIWHETKKDINGGVNIHNHQGAISAMSSKLVRTLSMPAGLFGTDDYVFVRNMRMGFSFKFAEDSRVFFRNPSTIRDYFKQHRRNLSAKHKLEEYFGPEILSLYQVPYGKKVSALLKGFLKSPFYAFSYVFLELLVRLALKAKSYKSPMFGWELSKTTKELA